MTLEKAEAGQNYIITEVRGSVKKRRRLMETGFAVGTRLYVAAVSPIGGTVLADVKDTQYMMRPKLAAMIEVVKTT